MGLCGLSLAWAQAAPRMGEVAIGVAQAAALLAGLLMLALLGLTLWRFERWPLTRVHDVAHPVRHVFVAAPTVSLILLATCGVTLSGPSAVWDVLWMTGAAAQAAVTVWVVLRWLRSGASAWIGVTPALLIPVVGNVLLPLAGLPLGHPLWSAVQWTAGAVLWPVILFLLVLRLQRLGPWPARMRPSVFILIAPPSVIGLGLMGWPWPLAGSLGLWCLALAFVVLALTQLPSCFDQPFGWPMWSLSFPLTAFAALTLKLVQATVLPQLLGLLALALASVVIAALLRWTWWGLRSGELLQPEPAPATPVPGLPGVRPK